MKIKSLKRSISTLLTCFAAALLGAGCATTGEKSSASSGSTAATASKNAKYKATDGRIIEIGSSTAAAGGRNFKDPHLEKCWIADGFDFNGYDAIYIAPVASTAKFNQKDSESITVHDLAKANLVATLAMFLEERRISARIVTKEADIKPEGKTLKFENTITEFSRGGGAARYFVGLYGGGQPVLRVQGRLSDGDKTLFTFQARRSGTSAGSRLAGVFMKDADIQMDDIKSMMLDLADFIAAIAGKYQAQN